MLWSKQGEFLACLEEPLALKDICAEAFSTSGELMAVAGVKGRITIWEIPSTMPVDNDSTVIRLLGTTVNYEHRGHLCLTPTKIFRYLIEHQTHVHSQEITALTFCPSMPWLVYAFA